MLTIDKQSDTSLYLQVVDIINNTLDEGGLKSGDRLPSLRKMSQRLEVSIPTVRQAYLELERQRKVLACEKSGYFVQGHSIKPLVQPATRFKHNIKPQRVSCRPVIDRVHDGVDNPDLVPLGIANPSMVRPAAKALHRSMKRIMASAQERSLSYSSTLGELRLRRQIAYRYFDQTGLTLDPDTICITNGAQEALMLALRTVAKKGDVIAVESPTYHGLLELIQSLGMLAIEVETCPEDGVCPKALIKTFEAYPVKACVFATTLGNPLGASMSDKQRAEIVAIIEKYNCYLIDDDVYSELRFDGVVPKPAFATAKSNKILTCGSFSKTAAPGYRVGWLLAGDHIDEVVRLKRAFSCSSGLLQQLTLSEFLSSGDYHRHLKHLRKALQVNCHRMHAMVAKHFPAETRTSLPVGGSVLWLELPKAVDAEELFDQAIQAGISIAPGQIFSPRKRFGNFIRLSYGHPWSEKIEQSIQWLGEAATSGR